MRTTKKLSKKLDKAVKKLMGLYQGDLPGSRIHNLVIQNKVSESQVYELLECHGYTWQQGKWQLPSPPSWLQDAIDRFESELERDDLSPWTVIPTRLRDITIFRDYLESMEAFVDTEMQGRHRELEKLKQNPNQVLDEDDMEVEWYFAYRSLEQGEEFAYILRNSFLVNLYAYIETFLAERCLPEKLPQNSIIKGATKQLVGPLVQKIPQWGEIQRHVELRNCIVHNGGILGKCKERYKELEKYVRDKSTLSTRDIREDIREEPIEQIILEKGFCEEILETVDKFLYSIHIISEEKKQSEI